MDLKSNITDENLNSRWVFTIRITNTYTNGEMTYKYKFLLQKFEVKIRINFFTILF
jgi:hypothetical protein